MPIHVLLAEDESLVAMVLKEVLVDAGFRVTVACDGVEALDAYTADPADILVTDIRMPRLDGLSLTAKLRERAPMLPVVITTGHLLPDIVMVEPSEARTLVFTKPVPTNRLLDAIRLALSADGS
ncbi:response regulator [Azospirillum himalayense]|uniref:Response regulator n=1 Tax=Azospirillum himalayense TaxID=654847 RepID=A0ABW0G576_9PROT